jgi:hypothetical protein
LYPKYAASAHTYRTLQDAKSAISAIGSQIESEGTPKDFGPLTFTFTGAGNVAQVGWLIVMVSKLFSKAGWLLIVQYDI